MFLQLLKKVNFATFSPLVFCHLFFQKKTFPYFQDLEKYYDRGEVDLEDALRRFFAQLYQRMFIVFNAQHSFDYA